MSQRSDLLRDLADPTMGDDITNSEVADFCKLMAKAIRDEEHLLIVNAFEVVAWETSSSKVKLVVMYLRDEICRGNSIPEVFRSLPDLFDDFFCNKIEEGVGAEALATTFDRLAKYLE